MLKKSKVKVTVVGSVNHDVFLRTKQLPACGETVIASKLWYNCGGKGANQATAVAKLGGESLMVCKVGDDDVGLKMKQNFDLNGVSTKHVRFESKESTGMAFVTVNEEGKNVIVVYPGANSKLSPDDLDLVKNDIKDSDVVVAQLEVPVNTIAKLSEMTREMGTTFVLNPAPVPTEDISYFLDRIDIICPNTSEAEKLTGLKINTIEDAKSAAKKMLAMGVGHVVITLGEKGALLADKEGVMHFPIKKVNAIDTTGAGDCFVGAFSCFLANGLDIKDAIVWANCASMVSVQREGTQSALPTMDEVGEFYANFSLNPKNLGEEVC